MAKPTIQDTYSQYRLTSEILEEQLRRLFPKVAVEDFSIDVSLDAIDRYGPKEHADGTSDGR
jgi:hypothetical protein